MRIRYGRTWHHAVFATFAAALTLIAARSLAQTQPANLSALQQLLKKLVAPAEERAHHTVCHDPAYAMERGLRVDFAFIKAWKGNRWGNLICRKTARNFNPMMATNADHIIAEVEELVDIGQLPPDQVHTPGIFVDAIFQGPKYEKRIERRTVRKL